MSYLPPLPPLEGIHPLVVHFPIALGLVSLPFAVAAVLGGKWRRQLAVITMILMVLTAGSMVAATLSGEAGEGAADGVAGAGVALERHEEAAELARNCFLGLAAAFAVLVLAPALVKKQAPPAARLAMGGLYVAGHLAGAAVLANAAHEGGRLVHEFGVRAPLGSTPFSEASPARSSPTDDD